MSSGIPLSSVEPMTYIQVPESMNHKWPNKPKEAQTDRDREP
jgi:hypothetical protein